MVILNCKLSIHINLRFSESTDSVKAATACTSTYRPTCRFELFSVLAFLLGLFNNEDLTSKSGKFKTTTLLC